MSTIADLHTLCLVDIFSYVSPDNAYALKEVCSSFKTAVKEWRKKYPRIKFKSPHSSFVIDSVAYIKWARTHLGFKLTVEHMKYAVKQGDHKIVKYLIKVKCPVGESASIEACQAGDKYALRLLSDTGLEFTDKTARSAAETGRTDLVELVKRLGADITDASVVDSAILSGNVLLVKNLLANRNCCWCFSSTSAYNAVSSGDMSMARFVLVDLFMRDASVQQTFVYSDLCAVAAGMGHLCVLEWLREVLRLGWDMNTCMAALCEDHPDCFEWAVKNGCPCPEELLAVFKEQYLRTT